MKHAIFSFFFIFFLQTLATQTYDISIRGDNVKIITYDESFNSMYRVMCPVSNNDFTYGKNINITYVEFEIKSDKPDFHMFFYHSYPDFWQMTKVPCQNYLCQYNVTFNASNCYLLFGGNMTISYYIYEIYEYINNTITNNGTNVTGSTNNTTHQSTDTTANVPRLEIYQIVLIVLGCLIFLVLVIIAVFLIANKTKKLILV